MTTHTELAAPTFAEFVDEAEATMEMVKRTFGTRGAPPKVIEAFATITMVEQLLKQCEQIRAAALESTERLAGGGEPVAWLYKTHAGDAQAFTNEPPPRLKELCLPLYTTPPPQAERVPLTLAQIDEVRISLKGTIYDLFDLARAIERAHGITPKEGT